MNDTQLFNNLRALNQNHLSQIQVDSVNAVLESSAKHAVTNVHQIAYIFATMQHECGLKPIEEYGKGAGHSYGAIDAVTHQGYWGRGYVQITFKSNYQTFSKLLGVDLVNHPGLALQPDYAAEIAVLGMKGGLFTGKSLSNYFTGVTNDPVTARKIINGTDKAELIAGYYSHILVGL